MNNKNDTDINKYIDPDSLIIKLPQPFQKISKLIG